MKQFNKGDTVYIVQLGVANIIQATITAPYNTNAYFVREQHYVDINGDIIDPDDFTPWERDTLRISRDIWDTPIQAYEASIQMDDLDRCIETFINDWITEGDYEQAISAFL